MFWLSLYFLPPFIFNCCCYYLYFGLREALENFAFYACLFIQIKFICMVNLYSSLALIVFLDWDLLLLGAMEQSSG